MCLPYQVSIATRLGGSHCHISFGPVSSTPASTPLLYKDWDPQSIRRTTYAIDTVKLGVGFFGYVTPSIEVLYISPQSTMVSVIPTPEPASVLLIVGGIVGLLGIARFRKTAEV